MNTLRNWVLAALVASTSFSVYAQDEDDDTFDSRWRIHGLVGSTFADDEDYDTGSEFKVGIGKAVSANVLVDAHINVSDLTTSRGDDYERQATGLDFVFFPYGAFELDADPLHPFFGVGITYHDIDFLGVNENNYGVDAFAGLHYKLDRVAIRAELRYQVDRISETTNSNNVVVLPDDNFYTYGALIGLSIPLGEKPKPYNYDSDEDGVPDRLDKCPNTPRGTPVDSDGCPLDSDGDGVPDFRDKCPNTPKGAKVNADGCSIDDDRDGVPNDIDKCPNTPYGVPVDSNGCPLDSDGDGVPDGVDQCPNTPPGVKVDSKGCALDSDGDGVPDKIDMCPNTLAGAKVNSRGCVIDQTVELKGVHFEFDKATLTLNSEAILDGVAKSMRNEPEVNIVIAGHTDSLGSDAYNKRLSQDRAQSVVNYLNANGIDLSRLRAVGYGESRPIADNSTDAGRARNRRVEIQLSK